MHNELRAALLGLLVLIGMVSFESRVEAGTPIDLNGDWTVSVEGGVSITCTAYVEQTGSSLRVVLSCLGAPNTPLRGEIGPEVRRVTLDSDGEQVVDIALDGTISPDGNSVDGMWEWSDGDLTGTFHATRGVQAPPVPDLRGIWSVETGDSPESCEATVQQTGADLQLDLQCPRSPSETFNGHLVGPNLKLSSISSEITATGTPDGLAIAGRWTVYNPCCDSGPFTGLKKTDHSFDSDATGDWRVTVSSGVLGVCEAAVEQSSTDEIFAAFDCGLAGGYWLRGPLEPETASFELVGMAGSERDFEATVIGVMSEDGDWFSGAFVAGRENSNSSLTGTLVGQHVDSDPSFMDVSGEQEWRLITRYGEEVSCEGAAQQNQEALTVPLSCAGLGAGTLDGWLSPLTGEAALEGVVGSVEFWLEGSANDEGPSVLQGQWASNQWLVAGCFTTSQTVDCELPRGALPGDATCDSRANSIDAAIVLQVVAGYLELGDVCDEAEGLYILRFQCCPVTITSVDAALILQINAGLLGRLVR